MFLMSQLNLAGTTAAQLKHRVEQFVPKSIVCLREGYGRAFLLQDLIAGVTVGVIALPLAMAFSINSGPGLTPQQGLYTAIIAGFVISLLGGSRVQIAGPTGAFMPILYAIVQKHGYDGLAVATIGTKFGGMPRELPKPHVESLWNAIKTQPIRQLIPEATTIAMLAAIESLLCCVVADGMIGGRHKSNCELVAQGLGNIASILFGGIPATGAIARTAANIKAGGKTPLAGMVHALFVLACMLLLAPLASPIA